MALSALISAWLAGILGGAHCIAMCGGFVAAFAGGADAARRGSAPLLPARALAWRQLSYNAGRVSTYALLGALAGGAGGALLSAAEWLPLQRAIYAVANIFLLALALAILWKGSTSVVALQRLGHTLFSKVLPAVRPLLAADSTAARYALGMVWGLVPCALTYTVLPIAVFAGGALPGAMVMMAFGLGTLPNLLAAGWIVTRAGPRLDAPAVRIAAAALIAGFAAVGLWRALFATGGLGQVPFCL